MSKNRISTEEIEQKLRAYFSAERTKLRDPADLWSKLEARLEAPPPRKEVLSLWRRLLPLRHWKPLPALAITAALLVIASTVWLTTAAPWRAQRPSSGGAASLLTVLDPSDGSVVSNGSVSVHGKTRPDATVLVNGNLAAKDPSGEFRLLVPLREGANALEITAISAGEQVVQQLNVIGAPLLASAVSGTEGDQPAVFLTLLEPADGSVVNAGSVPVHGRTHPGAVVLVNGRLAPVNQSGEFSLLVPLQEGPNPLEVTAVKADELVVQQLSVTSAPGVAPGFPASSVPAGGLFVSILDPPDGSIVATKSVAIRGRTKAGAVVIANDKMANAGPDGTFALKLNLDEGLNAIGIIALDERSQAETVLAVVFEPSGQPPRRLVRILPGDGARERR